MEIKYILHIDDVLDAEFIAANLMKNGYVLGMECGDDKCEIHIYDHVKLREKYICDNCPGNACGQCE